MREHTQGKVERVHAQAFLRSLNGESDVDILARCGDEIHSPETFGNAERIEAFWNAADGMPTEEAVKYIEEGPEMMAIIRLAQNHYKEGTQGWIEIEKMILRMQEAK